MVAGMGLAVVVSTCLWQCEALRRTCDTRLAEPKLFQFRACSQGACGLLPLTKLLSIFYNVISIYIHIEYKSKWHIVDFLFLDGIARSRERLCDGCMAVPGLPLH